MRKPCLATDVHKYTSLLYFGYLTICVNYTSSVIVLCSLLLAVLRISKTFVDILCLDKSYSLKVVKFCVHIAEHCFLMTVHGIIIFSNSLFSTTE